jgi:decaprenylphospho-beta-D-erythro-pentofuranosid-2-ulose 2-reductase
MRSIAGRRIVIVGATSAIAEHCARLWVGNGASELLLVGRDDAKLDRVAADLRVRNPACVVGTRSMDFLEPRAIAEGVEQIAASGPIDLVLIAHGSLPDQRICEADLETNASTLAINGSSPVLFAEAFTRAMLRVGRGTIVVIGSVAGDRGRKSNYVYGSAKGMVERYVQGLQHRLAKTDVVVVLVKPGPTDTPMTAHFKRQGVRLASVDAVARGIVASAARRKPVVYVPRKWALIMLVVRHLPRAVFNRMDI